MDNGKKTSSMESADMNGQMANNIKVISKIITKKVKAFSYGQMARATTEAGRITNNMVKLDSLIKKDKVKWACGRMERESSG